MYLIYISYIIKQMSLKLTKLTEQKCGFPLIRLYFKKLAQSFPGSKRMPNYDNYYYFSFSFPW